MSLSLRTPLPEFGLKAGSQRNPRLAFLVPAQQALAASTQELPAFPLQALTRLSIFASILNTFPAALLPAVEENTLNYCIPVGQEAKTTDVTFHESPFTNTDVAVFRTYPAAWGTRPDAGKTEKLVAVVACQEQDGLERVMAVDTGVLIGREFLQASDSAPTERVTLRRGDGTSQRYDVADYDDRKTALAGGYGGPFAIYYQVPQPCVLFYLPRSGRTALLPVRVDPTQRVEVTLPLWMKKHPASMREDAGLLLAVGSEDAVGELRYTRVLPPPALEVYVQAASTEAEEAVQRYNAVGQYFQQYDADGGPLYAPGDPSLHYFGNAAQTNNVEVQGEEGPRTAQFVMLAMRVPEIASHAGQFGPFVGSAVLAPRPPLSSRDSNLAFEKPRERDVDLTVVVVNKPATWLSSSADAPLQFLLAEGSVLLDPDVRAALGSKDRYLDKDNRLSFFDRSWPALAVKSPAWKFGDPLPPTLKLSQAPTLLRDLRKQNVPQSERRFVLGRLYLDFADSHPEWQLTLPSGGGQHELDVLLTGDAVAQEGALRELLKNDHALVDPDPLFAKLRDKSNRQQAPLTATVHQGTVLPPAHNFRKGESVPAALPVGLGQLRFGGQASQRLPPGPASGPSPLVPFSGVGNVLTSPRTLGPAPASPNTQAVPAAAATTQAPTTPAPASSTPVPSAPSTTAMAATTLAPQAFTPVPPAPAPSTAPPAFTPATPTPVQSAPAPSAPAPSVPVQSAPAHAPVLASVTNLLPSPAGRGSVPPSALRSMISSPARVPQSPVSSKLGGQPATASQGGFFFGAGSRLGGPSAADPQTLKRKADDDPGAGTRVLPSPFTSPPPSSFSRDWTPPEPRPLELTPPPQPSFPAPADSPIERPTTPLLPEYAPTPSERVVFDLETPAADEPSSGRKVDVWVINDDGSSSIELTPEPNYPF